MRFPWQKPEKRESAPYTDAVVQAIVAQTSGQTVADPSATAALEAASGLVARSFAAATVEGADICPSTLALIGRELIRRGEAIFLLEVAVGALRMVPVGSWDIRGGWNPDDWHYRVDLFGPSGNVTRLVPSASVLHFKYSVDPARPWHGLSPISWARLTGRLLANVETALADEGATPRGQIIPLPGNVDIDNRRALAADLENLRGAVAMPETTADNGGDGPGGAPRKDWVPQRVGANPPSALVDLRSEAALAILSACGVPVELVSRGDGTSSREAFRRFLHSTIGPLGKMIERELRLKLERPSLSISFDALFASDLSGRARAFQSLVNGGMDTNKAAGLAGLMEDA